MAKCHHLQILFVLILTLRTFNCDFMGISCAENLINSIYGVEDETLCQRNCIEELNCANYTYIYTNDVNCLLFRSCNIIATCEECISGNFNIIN